MRLIDADKLKEQFTFITHWTKTEICQEIENAPTVNTEDCESCPYCPKS